MAESLGRLARLAVPAAVVLAVAIPLQQAHAATPPKNLTKPVVTGTPSVGFTLTTTPGTWSGSPVPTFLYQWQRCKVNGSCSSISGATKTTYLVTSTDTGKQLRSRVIGKNSVGLATVFSARTAAVTAATGPLNTTLPTIFGSALDGASLTSSNGTWSGQTPITYTRQWFRCTATCTAIGGATLPSYLVQSLDVGTKLQVRVTGTNAVGSATATSAMTGTIAPAPPTNQTPPATVGTPTSGVQLSSTPGTWKGTPPFIYGYSWSTCDSTGQNCAAINGANAGTYTPQPSNIGARLKVTVTASNGTNPAGVASSAASPAVVAGPNPPVNNTVPTIDVTTPTDGSLLTVTPGTWTKAGTLLHTWQQCDALGANCTAIGGATNASYTVVATDVGHKIRVLETTSNTDGMASAASAVTAVVAPSAPVNNGALPSFSGALLDGATLSAAPGDWSGTPTVTFTYQWQSAPDNSTFTNVAGATLPTYQLVPGDVTRYFRVVVTAHNASSATPSATSSVQGPVALAPPSVLLNPSITGATQVHSTLLASPGTWNGTNLSAPSYSWLRCPQATVPPAVGSCTALAANGGTPDQYTLVAADRDTVVVVGVTRSNTLGTLTAYTVPTAVIAPAGPINTAAPGVQGTAQVGKTLTATNGAWAPSDSSFSYQVGDLNYQYLWQQCTAPNACTPEPSGANASSYLVRNYDLGTTIAVSVTATDKYGQQSTSVLSPPSGTVSANASPVTVASWSMADGGDGVMNDGSGYGNSGALQNVAIGQADHTAAIAYGFPLVAGTVSRVVVPYSPSLDPRTTRMTVTMHVKFDAWPAAAVGDYDLMRKGLSEDGQDWKVEILQGGHARCYANGASGPVDLSSANAVPVGAWHTIVCTFMSTGATIQVDGGTVKSKIATVGSISNTAPLSIGAKVSTGLDDAGDQYTGKMDQVVITSG